MGRAADGVCEQIGSRIVGDGAGGQAGKLGELMGRKWHLQPASAVSGDGLMEGLDWANRTLETKKNEKKNRFRILLSIVPFFQCLVS